MKEKSGIALIIGIGGGCGCKGKGCPVCEGEKMETSFTAPEGFDFEGMDFEKFWALFRLLTNTIEVPVTMEGNCDACLNYPGYKSKSIVIDTKMST